MNILKIMFETNFSIVVYGHELETSLHQNICHPLFYYYVDNKSLCKTEMNNFLLRVFRS